MSEAPSMAIWRKAVAVLARQATLHAAGTLKINLRGLPGRRLWAARGFGDRILVEAAYHLTVCIQPAYLGNASHRSRFCIRHKKLHFND